ncbi:DNA-directed RNA polymerase core subunit rpc40 [Vermiconidia calcicola]|uniref:DNA-directed RNA polymerase core subunit rpc40 n=1 Tax=Vermiconidia calcicola TaxID=1690605 RepID=A0ACC3NMN5_9PEZI|nr:DNA-directed RNA polymerase core subunit rpc40 [Vermiconidia calcicola]
MPAHEQSNPWAPLTPSQLEQRKIVSVNPETVSHTAATDIPGHWGPAQDDSWNLSRFRDSLKVDFHHNKPHDAAFSLVGVDASIANAFRRILLAEIPTLAIEDVFVFDNTSIIQDEVLAHRLGLIPLTGGQEGLKWLKWFRKPPPKDDFAAQAAWEAEEGEDSAASVPSDYNTIVLTLNVTCRWATKAEDGRDGKALAKDGESDPNVRYVNSNVYAKDLVFEPQGQQEKYFNEEEGNQIRPVNPDILIAKLRPGQRIHVRCHCIKGIGADHAKFSPVATASYRLLPQINITQPILGADAKKFARCFPKGVIGLEPSPDNDSDELQAVVKDPMKDTVSRECLRHAEFKDKVKLGRVRDHFIFSVESTGQFGSSELMLDSVRLLRAKAERFNRHLTELEEGR